MKLILYSRFSIVSILILSFFVQTSIFAVNTKLFNGSNKFQYYKERYKVNCANEKITDNFGNGFDSLYGTRNMRTILYGVAYRGGANNYYHKENKRDNHNPLTEDGLINLMNEGFSTSVYLYSTNFSDAKKFFTNENLDTLIYIQNSGNDRNNLKKLMLLVYSVIKNPDKGPIYFHCWNGWHQSGYVSATILIQFCKLSNEEAYNYWLENTDGVNKGYEKVKSLVKNFVPFDDIYINDSIRKEICPCMSK